MRIVADVGTLSVLAYVGGGAVLLWLVRLAVRGRRSDRTEVGPVSEQWLAERRGQRHPDH